MKCNYCNYQNPDSARFCQQCGAPLFQPQPPQGQFVPQGNPAMGQPQGQFVPQGNVSSSPQGQFVSQENTTIDFPENSKNNGKVSNKQPQGMPSNKGQNAFGHNQNYQNADSKNESSHKAKKVWRNIFGVLTILSFIFTIYWVLSMTVLKKEHNYSLPSYSQYYELKYNGEPRYEEAYYMTYEEYVDAHKHYRDPFGIANYDEMIKCFLGGIFGLIIFGGLFALFFFKTRKKPQPIYPPYNQFYPPYPPANNTGSNYQQMQ